MSESIKSQDERVLSVRQQRYLLWLGVTILLGLAIRYGVWPPAGTVILPAAPPEFVSAPPASGDTVVSLTSPDLQRAGAKSVTVTFPGQAEPKPPEPPTPPRPTRERTVDQVRSAVGTVNFRGGGMCSGQFVDLSHEGEESWTLKDGTGLIVNAAHCGGVGQAAVFRLPDGRSFDCVVVAAARNPDASWLRTRGPVAGAVPTVVLARNSPAPETPIWHCGHGWDLPRNIEFGRVVGRSLPDGKLPLFIDVSQGDSGGGFFRRDTNECFSTGCCTERVAVPANAYGPSTESLREMLAVARVSRVRNKAGLPTAEELKQIQDEQEKRPAEMPPGK